MRKDQKDTEEIMKSPKRKRHLAKRIGRGLALVGAGLIGFGIAQVVRKDSA